jgi:Trypsin-co-occurring domain 1
MTQPQRLILEDDTTTYNVFIDSLTPVRAVPDRQSEDDNYESYGPQRGFSTVTPEVRVKLAEVHRTIQGYTQYAIGAFKNLAIANVEEITLKFNLKISAEGGLPMIASGKTESDFAIEVKCKFPKNDLPKSP